MGFAVRTRAYWWFVVVGFSELAALVVIGHSTIAVKGVALVCALAVWLGFGSSAAWWLFVVGNAAQLAMTLAIVLASGGGSFGAGVDWGDTAAVIGGSGALLAILLSGGMRAAVRSPAGRATRDGRWVTRRTRSPGA